MIPLRYASGLLALISLACLLVAPLGPASIPLVGLLIASAGIHRWTYPQEKK